MQGNSMLDRSCFGLDLGLYCGRGWNGEGRRTIGCAPAKPRSTAVSGAWEAVAAARRLRTRTTPCRHQPTPPQPRRGA